MELDGIITQIQEGINEKGNLFRCCGCEFKNFYDFRKHLYENHPDEYLQLVPYMHKEPPKPFNKEERRKSIRQALKRKQIAKKGKGRIKVKVDYSKQPSAWIIYNHNGPKIK